MTARDFAERPTTAYDAARQQFEAFAGMDSPDLPVDRVSALQVRLWRWQVANFGVQSDERYTLGILEELDETFNSTDMAGALDGLGDVCVYAGQLLIANRLAIAPVLELAASTLSIGLATMRPGRLAHVVLKHAQKIRGMGDGDVYRAALVHETAWAIARAWRAAEAMSRYIVIADVYATIGEQVLQRGKGHAAIPKAVGL